MSQTALNKSLDASAKQRFCYEYYPLNLNLSLAASSSDSYTVGTSCSFIKFSSSKYFDYTDYEHQPVPESAGYIIVDRRHILVPIHQKMKEFIESGNYRRDRKAQTQNLVGLITRSAYRIGH